MGAVNDSFQYARLNSMRVTWPLSSGQQSAQAFSSVWFFCSKGAKAARGEPQQPGLAEGLPGSLARNENSSSLVEALRFSQISASF